MNQQPSTQHHDPPDDRHIRRLKLPQAIEVEDANGAPLRVRLGGNNWLTVTLTRHPWRIDQYWWRAEPVRRTYFSIALEDGPPLTIYHDEIADAWFRQEY